MNTDHRTLCLFFAALVVVFLGACGGGGGGGSAPENHAPIAVITAPAGAMSAAAGEAVTFTGTCSDPDGDVVTGGWAIPGSDHATASGLGPVVVRFGTVGSYQVTFTCTDARGLSGSAVKDITVVAPNRAPAASILQPANDPLITAGESVTFTGSCTDPDGDVVTGGWAIPGSDHATVPGLGPVLARFGMVGTHEVTFTCTDARGLSSFATRTVDVRAVDEAVGLRASAPLRVPAGSQWGYAVVAHVVNASGDVLAEAGIPVTVAVQGLGGGLSGTVIATTAVDGSAVFPDVAFTAGAQGARTLLFTSAGLQSATADVDVGPGHGFGITLRWLSSADTEQRAAFDQARIQWENVIVGDLADFPATNLDCWGQTVNELIDDVLIFASVVPIDGAGGTLASAGPCYIRSSTKLPIVGQMMFDSEDLDFLATGGRLRSVVLHEMGHVLGFGTVWTFFPGLLVNDHMPDPYFAGAFANDAFLGRNNGAYYTGTPVPVESSGGTGTAYSHWRESVFGRELMTGWLSGGDQPLSATTIGSLADMGYVTDPSAADPFDIAWAQLRSPDAGPEIPLVNDILPGPAVPLDDAWNTSP